MNAHIQDIPAHNCLDHLEYEAHIGAPGYGVAYTCTICDEPFWSPNSKAHAVPYDEPHELSIEDVI